MYRTFRSGVSILPRWHAPRRAPGPTASRRGTPGRPSGTARPFRLPAIAVMALAIAVSVAPRSALAEVTEVDARELAALLADGAVVVDVRREDEWRARGMLEGARPLTFFERGGRYDIERWLDALAEMVAPDETVVLVCAHGVRSKRIATLLDERLGYSSVHNVTDGIEGWRQRGGAIVPYRP